MLAGDICPEMSAKKCWEQKTLENPVSAAGKRGAENKKVSSCVFEDRSLSASGNYLREIGEGNGVRSCLPLVFAPSQN